MTAARTPSYELWREQRACGNKVRYSGRRVAENAATALTWRGRDLLEPYLCTWCEYWHLGHPLGEREPA